MLKISIIEPNKDRAFEIVDGLMSDDSYEINIIGDITGIARKLELQKPDVVVVDLENPSHNQFTQIVVAVAPTLRPVVMFIQKSDFNMMRSAIDAGVSAYVVDGFKKERINNVLQTAVARFNQDQKVRSELQASKTALAEQKDVDRAKVLLMQMRGLSEQDAYATLRKAAMDQGKRIPEVSVSLITAAGLLN